MLLHVYFYLLAVCVFPIISFLAIFPKGNNETVIGTIVIYVISSVIWGLVLLGCIINEVKEVIEKYNKIRSLRKQKTSFETEMEIYKGEMQTELLDKYREFETALSTNIKDSKLLAAILQESGYHKILSDYNSTIKNYLSSIHQKDRKIEENKSEIKTVLDNFLGVRAFLPKKFKQLHSQLLNDEEF